MWGGHKEIWRRSRADVFGAVYGRAGSKEMQGLEGRHRRREVEVGELEGVESRDGVVEGWDGARHCGGRVAMKAVRCGERDVS